VPDAVLSAILQVAVFTAVPFFTYLATRRRAAGFAEYIGMFAPTARAMALATAFSVATLGLLALVLALVPEVRGALAGPGTPAGRLREAGPTALGIGLLLVGALIQTSLSEEILFRGFVAKRLIDRLGFQWGNVLQAVIFALPHLALLLVPDAHPTAAAAAGLFLYPFAMGLFLAYLNERIGNGSIVPGWWAHALGNACGYALLAFGCCDSQFLPPAEDPTSARSSAP
jgi:membrane protease YdiL (CAAX protease family)